MQLASKNVKLCKFMEKKEEKFGHIGEKGRSQTQVSALVSCYFAADYSRVVLICCDSNKKYEIVCSLLFNYNN